jgi:polyhydroxyalkanoate synthesis regulator phasin
MKKPITLLLLLAFIIPQIASAAWYNPFTWSIWTVFKTKDTQTEILQKKVQELETKLNSTQDTSIAIPATTTVEESSFKSVPITTKISPNKNNSVTTKVTTPVQTPAVIVPVVPTVTVTPQEESPTALVSIIGTKISKLVEIRDSVKSLENTSGITDSDKNLVLGETSKITTTINNATSDSTNFRAIIARTSVADLSNTVTSLKKTIADLENKISQYNGDYSSMSINVQANANRQSLDSVNANQAKLDSINRNIAILNAKYAVDKSKLSTNPEGLDTAGLQGRLDNLRTTYKDNYDLLMAEFQLVQTSN